MKKTGTFLFFAFVAAMPSFAQLDTISFPLPTYYYDKTHPSWVDDTMLKKDYFLTEYDFGGGGEAFAEFVKKCFTKDTLKVYGVAAALFVTGSEWDTEGDACRPTIDTTLDGLCEYFRIFKPTSTGDLVLLDQTPVCALDPPVALAQYYNPGENDLGYGARQFKPRRIFESYFENGPIVVIDSFYVGITNFQDTMVWIDGYAYWKTLRILAMGLAQWGLYPPIPMELTDEVKYRSGYTGWEWVSTRKRCFMFPIFNPDEYTSQIEQAEGLSRYVNVYPNPAKEYARVVSSFPMTRLDVYDAAGRKVYTQEANGVTSDVNTRSWAPGLYLVKVSTIMGEVTKKLQVQ